MAMPPKSRGGRMRPASSCSYSASRSTCEDPLRRSPLGPDGCARSSRTRGWHRVDGSRLTSGCSCPGSRNGRRTPHREAESGPDACRPSLPLSDRRRATRNLPEDDRSDREAAPSLGAQLLGVPRWASGITNAREPANSCCSRRPWPSTRFRGSSTWRDCCLLAPSAPLGMAKIQQNERPSTSGVEALIQVWHSGAQPLTDPRRS